MQDTSKTVESLILASFSEVKINMAPALLSAVTVPAVYSRRESLLAFLGLISVTVVRSRSHVAIDPSALSVKDRSKLRRSLHFPISIRQDSKSRKARIATVLERFAPPSGRAL